MGKDYVGLDVHSKQSTFVIEDAEGTVIARGEVPTTRPAFERLCAGTVRAHGRARLPPQADRGGQHASIQERPRRQRPR